MKTDDFEHRLQALRPRLHRYCARITGSVVDGEDAVQDTLVKALHVWTEGTEISNLDVWLLHAEETQWRFSFGAIEGRPAMLVFSNIKPSEKPAHFVLIDWQGDQIAAIRDFLFVPYVSEVADWVLLR